MKFVERNLYWLPYLTMLLVAWSEVQAAESFSKYGVGGLVFGKAGLLLIATIILLSLQLKLCFHPLTRFKAISTMVSAAVVTLLLFTILEILTPPVYHYSEFQVAIQRQLARRETKKEIPYRGIVLRQDANYLGFFDRDREYESNRPRVVFVGDSFLEIMSTKPLASRVEERLRQRGIEIDVLNLSKDDTDLDPDYRHKLHELVFDYHPDHVFIFIYAGNDLHRRYRYVPYQHPPYNVSKEAISFLQDADMGDAALTKLEQLRRDGTVFESRAALLENLQAINMDLHKQNLTYLTCLAYSHAASPSLFRRIWPSTIERFGLASSRISREWKKIRKLLRSTARGCRGAPVEEIMDQLNRIRDLPGDQHVLALARFMAFDYCGTDDAEPYLQVLLKLDPAIIDIIIKSPVPPGFLLKALVAAAAGNELERPYDQSTLESSADEYRKLFSEFEELAASQGASLTVFLIPVASNADEAYYTYWKQLADMRQYYQRRKVIRGEVRKRLAGKIPTIDFMDYADQFDGGYWIFDGHWNEEGNDTAARILADYIITLNLTAQK
jgi:hypothetical protein